MKIVHPLPLRRASIALLFALGTGGFGAAAGAQNVPTPRVSAPSLIAIAANALGTVQRAASADARLSANPARVAPFWASLQGANQALAEVGAGLGGGPGGRPAGDLFSRIARAGGRIAELNASWQRIGVGNAGVQAGLATLATSWRVFRGTYGPEGVRHRQDRPLSAEEAHRLEVVRRAQEQLARQLERLEAKARRAHETEEARRLAQFRARAQASLLAANDLDAYLTALAALPEIAGEWAALKAAAPKARRVAYAAVDPIVEQIQTEAETGSVMVLDLDQGKAWNFLQQTTELPESLAAAAAVFDATEPEDAAEGVEAAPEADKEAAPEGEISCAEDDEECLAAAEGDGANPETDAQGTVPPAVPAFPGSCGDSSADGCQAAPELAPVPQATATPASPPGEKQSS
ncbi:MAG TPA: hypothetical protein VGS22_09010 [Thermoanaerobaculia bacterium]|jgi:hypothetical protein|nr:hypothetical protein [Thermoanaerobaculia bacterium]